MILLLINYEVRFHTTIRAIRFFLAPSDLEVLFLSQDDISLKHSGIVPS